MPFPTRHPAVHLARGLSALGLGLALAACGEGGVADHGAAASGAASDKAAPAAPLAAAPSTVTVEGCVLDRSYIPVTDTPVRVLATDGRLLGSARSDAQGRFTLRLPALGAVLLQVDRPQGESLPMRAEAGSATWAKCLLDDRTGGGAMTAAAVQRRSARRATIAPGAPGRARPPGARQATIADARGDHRWVP